MHTGDPNTKMSLGGAQSGPTPSGVLHLSAICSAELRTGATEEGQPGTWASWL